MFKRLAARRKKNAIHPEEHLPGNSTPDTDTDLAPASRISVIESSTSLDLGASRRTSSSSGRALSRNNSSEDGGPLGVNVVYTPEHGRKVDIVFVHGLGGTSRSTWSKRKSPELFWPLTFLPQEPDICLARILTFGYNGGFRTSGSSTVSILDFAKELLNDLKFGVDEDEENLHIGQVPLIFVVHSMGGLIVKEAYLLGQNDPTYEAIVHAISAIAFLATPHRGSNLAQTLNRILDSSMMISNSRQFIADLMKNSPTLQRLNEQFRHVAPKLDIVSFYETLETPLGWSRARAMVVERDSSTLGYPGEVSRALNADHHNVCKYDSLEDPNYIIVRNILKSLVSKIIAKKGLSNTKYTDRRASVDLKTLLAISDPPFTDYIFFRDRWTPGTNDWITQEESFQEWRDSHDGISRLMWLSGGAATGKSVMSSYLINTLIEGGYSCQYFFFAFGDRKKQTLSLLVRSLAYQIALAVSGLLPKVTELIDEAIDFENVDPKIIWDRIFKSMLFECEFNEPLYWIIDGLDEAEDPPSVIKLLSDVCFSNVPIKVLFAGRRTSTIINAFKKLPRDCMLITISIEGRTADMHRYISEHLTIAGGTEFMEDVKRRIIDGSQNNFLWVRLAVEGLNHCHTHDDVDLVLRERPVGMEAIYDRMAQSINDTPNSKDKLLAISILEIVTCSLRILKVVELSEALILGTGIMLNLEKTVVDLCCGFVTVDNSGNVSMIHKTAHDYLLDSANGVQILSIDGRLAHERLFLRSMRCLMQPGLRAKLFLKKAPEFLEYAASSWSRHLVAISGQQAEVTLTLTSFLKSNNVLTWIYLQAAAGQLQVLVRTSKDLATFATKLKNKRESTDMRTLEEVELLQSWAVDLLKIVGKFNRLLRRNPSSIYTTIPPLCPKTSSIYQHFGRSEARNLAVVGLSSESWDDYLARIPIGPGNSSFASSITASGSQIAILASGGQVYLFDSSDFTELKSSPIHHKEPVDRIHMNSTATLLVTYGYKNAKLWEVQTGACRLSIECVQSRTRPLAMLFTAKNNRLLVGFDDRKIRSLDLSEAQPTWEIEAALDEQELEGDLLFMGSASHIAFSKDGSLVAIAYRSYPLSAWALDGPTHIGHCWRQNATDAIRELRELVWHPHLPQLLALNLEGMVIKWDPFDGDIYELPVMATRLSLSGSGEVFATSDGHGRLKIFQTSTFTLVYQLAAQDSVFGMTFSPDSRRLYDIRGYYANAWEPNALIKLAELSGEDVSSLTTSEASLVTLGVVDSITALAASPKGRLYCCGTERGTVTLHDTQLGKIADLHTSRGKFTIEGLVWSSDGKYVCFYDMSRQVIVVAIDYTHRIDGSKPTIGQKAIVPLRSFIKGPIQQLVFHPDASKILVHSVSQISCISTASFDVEHCRDVEDLQIRWLVHPEDPSLVLGYGPSNIYVLDWTLDEKQRHRLSRPREAEISNTDSSVLGEDVYEIDRVLVTTSKRYIILQMSHSHNKSAAKQLYFHEASGIARNTGIVKIPVDLHPVSDKFCSSVARALSFLQNDRLVFLSKNFAICSFRVSWDTYKTRSSQELDVHSTQRGTPSPQPKGFTVGSVAGRQADQIQELFGLPGDWISRDALRVCDIWAMEKSFLCPRNGELAVVKCAKLV